MCSMLKRVQSAAPSVSNPSPTLYDRLGGVAGVSKIVACLYQRLVADPRIGGFWKGHSNDRMAKERQSVVDMICQGTGGPPANLGPDMHASHDGLVIVEADWTIFSDLATAAMSDCGVAAVETQELLAFFDSFKGVMDVKKLPDSNSHTAHMDTHGLSRRELEVLKLVAEGMNNPRIAEDLSISLNTVTRHITNIFRKTGSSNRVEAAMYAARIGLVP